MSPQDLRLRFFTAMKGLSHQLAARLTQIDYDREMALIALEADADQVLGVSCFAADPDNGQAEYGVEVRSDWKGRGLGYLLMTRLIDVARQRRIGELVGEVLRETRSCCRCVGRSASGSASIRKIPADPSLVRVTKPLREGMISVRDDP
jgi:acetyltransferase